MQAQDQDEIIKTMAACYRRTHYPEAVNTRKKLASVADFQIEANAAVKRGRQIMSGVSPEQIRGREAVRAIRESQAAQTGKRGERNFPPARKVVK